MLLEAFGTWSGMENGLWKVEVATWKPAPKVRARRLPGVWRKLILLTMKPGETKV